MTCVCAKKGHLPVKCFRCKSAEHMVQKCPFPAAQTTMETGSKAQKTITRQQDRWYYNGATTSEQVSADSKKLVGRPMSAVNVKAQSQKVNVEGATPKLPQEVTSPLNKH